jgi:hypothetical protein
MLIGFTYKEIKMFRKALAIAALAVFLMTGAANAALVTNGDFETGDLSGWTVTPSDAFAFVSGPGYMSDNEAVIGGVATVSQDLATTAGTSYTVSFYLANDDFDHANSFSVLWNGTEALLAVSNGDAFDYTQFTFTGVADSSNTTLSFIVQNDGAVFHLDDVSASAVPIPAAIWLLGSALLGLTGVKKKLS